MGAPADGLNGTGVPSAPDPDASLPAGRRPGHPSAHGQLVGTADRAVVRPRTGGYGLRDCPDPVIARAGPGPDDRAVTRRGPATIAGTPAGSRARHGTTAGTAAVGIGLVASGAVLAWLLAATPALERLADPIAGRSSPLAAWTLALVIATAAVAGSVFVGLGRLGLVVATVRPRATDRGMVSRLARRLPPDCLAVPTLTLPDGRRISDLVIGPFGVVIFAPAPTAHGARTIGTSWEERDADGAWRSAENPAERVGRDADRLRFFLAAQERDFVVRVMAVLVGSDPDAVGASGVPIVRHDDIPAWLAALRPQRSLTPDRLARLQAWLADPA